MLSFLRFLRSLRVKPAVGAVDNALPPVGTRGGTADLPLPKRALCQLSYVSKCPRQDSNLGPPDP